MEQQDTPHISVNAQYIKDLSFENPNAPGILAVDQEEAPKINLHLDLHVSSMPEEDYYEVEIAIEAEAKLKDQRMFLVDLKYAGIFHIINMQDDQRELVLAVHCPALIFPFARKIIADVTQNGGFQPLMMDPIDFGALYMKKIQEDSAKS